MRYRVDGVLQEVLTLPPASLPALLARMKILCGDADRRAPDPPGRPLPGRSRRLRVDLRVSSVPTRGGRSSFCACSRARRPPLDLEDLGLVPADYELLSEQPAAPVRDDPRHRADRLGQDHDALRDAEALGIERQNAVNISTIEEPMEYTMPRVTQIPVNRRPASSSPAGCGRCYARIPTSSWSARSATGRRSTSACGPRWWAGCCLSDPAHQRHGRGRPAAARHRRGAVPPGLDPQPRHGPALRPPYLCRLPQQVRPRSRAVDRAAARPDFERERRLLRAQGVLRTGGSARPGSGPSVAGLAQCQGTGFRGRLGVFELFEVRRRIRGR